MFVLLLFTGIFNHVIILPHLLGVAKRDSWVCVLISYVIFLFWIGVYSYIFSKNKQRLPLMRWLELRINKSIAKLIMLLFTMYILIIGIISFFDLIVIVNIHFLPLTATGVVIIPFLLLCIWAASSGLKTIVYTSAVLLPIVWLLGHFVAFSTMDEKDYSYLFPLFVDDEVSIIRGVLTVLGGGVDLLILFLLQQYFQKPISYLYLALTVTLLTGLVVGPTMGVLAAFGPSVAANLRFPAFDLWRLLTIGEYFSHVDALAVFQLLCGVVIRISLCMFLLPDMWIIQSSKRRTLLIMSFAFVLAVIMLLQISDIWKQTILRNYYHPNIFYYGLGVTLLLLAISYFPEKRGVHKYEGQHSTNAN